MDLNSTLAAMKNGNVTNDDDNNDNNATAAIPLSPPHPQLFQSNLQLLAQPLNQFTTLLTSINTQHQGNASPKTS